MQKKRNMRLQHLVLFILLLSGCTASKPYADDSAYEPEVQSVSASKIIFINCKASKKDGDSFRIDLINKIIVDGDLKENDLMESASSEMNIICTELNHNAQPINKFYIPNPLIKDIEYINNNNELSRKQIEVDSADFSVRLQLDPSTKFVSFQLKDKTLLKVAI